MSRARILITGAGGFLGGQIGRWLSQCGYDVTACVRRCESIAVAPGSRCYVADLPDASFADIVAAARPDWLVHCAGPSRVDRSFIDPDGDFHASVVVTQHVLESLAKRSPQTGIVFLSSGAVYGEPAQLPITERTPPRPISPYGRHKLACEQLALEHHRRHGAPVVVLRVFSAYGPGLRRQVLWDICHKARTLPIVTLDGTGDERRDFVHVDDVARLVSLLIARGHGACETFNVASGRSVTIAAVAQSIVDLLGMRRRIAFTGRPRRGFPCRWEVDVTALQQVGMRDFTPWEAGLRRYVTWASEQSGGSDARRVLAVAG